MDLPTFDYFSFSKRRAYMSLFSLLFFFSIFGCNRPSESDAKQKAKDKVEIFFSKLPVENVDSTAALIEKSITNKADLDYLHERMIDTLDYYSGRSKFPFPSLAYLERHIDTLNPTLQGALYAAKGKAYYYIGKTDSSFLLLNKGIKLLVQGNDSALICRGYINICKLYSMQNATLIGTENALTGLKYVPKVIHDPKYPQNNGIIKTVLKLTLLSFYSQKESKKAKLLAMEMLPELEEERRTILYKTLAFSFYKLHQPDSVLWAAEKQSNVFYRNKKRQTAYNAYNLGASWSCAEQTDKAISYFLLGKHLADSTNNKTASQSCVLNLGNAYLRRSELAKAQLFYEELKDNQLFQGNKVLFKALTDSLMVLQLKKRNPSEGLAYFYQSKRLGDSLNNSELNFLWTDMNVRYETSEKESKIKSLLLDKRDLQLQALIIAFLLLLLLSVSTFLFYRNRQRQLQLSNQNILLASQQQTLEITKQLQEQEIIMHKQQLSVFQENMVAKNILITEMQTQMNDIMNNSAHLAKKEADENREKLNQLKILTEKDWRVYLAHFERVYPHFIEKVEQHFPNLTKAELRLFLVIYSGLIKEELSSFLGISDEGVRKAKYRLKTKINLSEEENIDEFILKF
jgi:hypothetical protein